MLKRVKSINQLIVHIINSEKMNPKSQTGQNKKVMNNLVCAQRFNRRCSALGATGRTRRARQPARVDKVVNFQFRRGGQRFQLPLSRLPRLRVVFVGVATQRKSVEFQPDVQTIIGHCLQRTSQRVKSERRDFTYFQLRMYSIIGRNVVKIKLKKNENN